jgi:hypothetical protein
LDRCGEIAPPPYATLRGAVKAREGAEVEARASTHATLAAVRALLISNSGRPWLAHVRAELFDFLGPSRRVGFVTAAPLGDAAVPRGEYSPGQRLPTG